MPSNHGAFWARFPSHTRLKHAILRAYLGAWAKIHSQAGHRRVWFVDGFAGRGRDDEGSEGSPLIACLIANELASDSGGVSGTTQLRVVAVEELRANHTALVENIRPFVDGPARPTTFLGSINDIYPQILSLTAGAPTLFFLDPWGVEGLNAQMIAQMLAGDKKEVLVLFSEEATDRLRAAVRSEPHPDRGQFADLFGNPTQTPRPSAQAYREADERILNDVFAGLWHLVDQTAEMNPGQERDSYLDSYLQVQRRLGAEYVLPMSITDEAGEHKYSLVHASKHGKALTVMKEALNTAMRRRLASSPLSLFQITPPGLGRLCDQIATAFAGKLVRWQDRDNADTVRRYAVEETWALMSDMSDIKSELRRRGYQVRARPITYQFPSPR